MGLQRYMDLKFRVSGMNSMKAQFCNTVLGSPVSQTHLIVYTAGGHP